MEVAGSRSRAQISRGIYVRPVLGGHPCQTDDLFAVFVTAASWSVAWRLEPRLNYVAINIPPPTLQLGSGTPQS